MILVAIISAIVSFVSPFLGLFLIVGFGAKYLVPKQNIVFWVVNLSLIVFAVVFAKNKVYYLTGFDAIFGALFGGIIFFWALNSSKSMAKALSVIFLFELVIGILRSYLFKEQILNTVLTAYNLYDGYVTEKFVDIPDKMMLAKDMLLKVKNFLGFYQIAIWTFSEISFLYIASIVASKKKTIELVHKRIRMPYIFVYLLIAFLALALFKQTKVLGLNLLISISMLYFIQGFSILDFFWGKMFRRSKFLLILLIISLFLNTFIMILIALTGLTDVWLDYRKLNENQK